MLSVLILATNEAEDIGVCVESARSSAQEIVVIDGGSSDKTVEIARSLGAKVFERSFDDFTSQRAFGLEQTAGEWVLSLDADERLSPNLAQEISAVLASTQRDGYVIPFEVQFMGKTMRHSGLGGETHLRLFRKDKVKLAKNHSVHEVYELPPGSRVGRLGGFIKHRPYRDIAEYLIKCDFYADLYARDFLSAKKTLSLRHQLVPAYEFFRCYFLRLGFLDGFPGLAWAALSAYHRKTRLAKIRTLLGSQNA